MDFHFPIEPIQFLYGAVAICGGIARYLNSYVTGVPFRFSNFLASGFVSGFSGWMFALIGTSMHFQGTMLFIMAGTGGFMGDQTMKLIVEWLQKRVV